MNIPNVLTVARFIIIPVFGYSLITEGSNYTVPVVLFLVGGLTDVLDGYIARRFNMITSWGKFADPLADKLMQITALVLLTIKQIVPLSILVIVVVKEVFIGLGILMLYKKENVVESANWYGKMATVVFYAAIVLAILNKDTKPYGSILMIVAVAITLFAFVMYAMKYMRIRKILKE